ncbi:uncharacterized protein LOC130898268 [Diorhabda carinulata]|uniref:uncharacterized protein LOC130449019 n=1 Tax=Diorhabda sublineata TaxID=1163346 RepID=UPI0024E04FF5|nr:uncharacterized protein LOC130449019 [Diorhabda sublineata]XP_057663420.1 uncharacterized protein LOC130898268 [Diorhabda carinulata]
MRGLIFYMLLLVATEGLPIGRPPLLEDYPDYQLGVRYDEYPLIVPKKRTAILMNRLMVALKEALENEGRKDTLRNGNNLDEFFSKTSMNYPMGEEDIRSMDRRGHGNMSTQKARSYWRCYFNAVTCF